MKTKLLVALSTFVLVFSACQKDPDDTTDNPGTETEDYQPTSAGSTWQYNSTNAGSYTETALAGDTTISGQKYFIIESTDNDRRYINKNGGIYTQYGYVEEIDETLNLVYLKDAAVGTTWEQSVDYNGVPVVFNFTIVSRDGDKVVNGTTYNNVVAVDLEVVANSPLVGGEVTIATGRQFYAKGIGSISSSLNFSALGTEISDSTYLVSYDIK